MHNPSSNDKLITPDQAGILNWFKDTFIELVKNSCCLLTFCKGATPTFIIRIVNVVLHEQ